MGIADASRPFSPVRHRRRSRSFRNHELRRQFLPHPPSLHSMLYADFDVVQPLPVCMVLQRRAPTERKSLLQGSCRVSALNPPCLTFRIGLVTARNAWRPPPPPSHHVVIQTPPPAVPEVMTVSAIFFLPSQGELPTFRGVHRKLTCRPPFRPDRPQVINVNCQMSRKPHAGTCPTPLISEYFPDGPPQSIVLTQGLNGEPLRFPLHIFYCPVALQRNTPVNRAIYRITSGAAPRAWPGPVLVLKFNGSRRQSYSDASTNDLPALSAYFLAFK